MKLVAIVSGGMDSVTMLYDLVKQGHDVKALSFNYGQRHKKELKCAKKVCKKLGVEHKLVKLLSITDLISNSALTGNVEVPEGHYADESMKLTVVPNRNMIMLSIAIGYAENLKYEAVAYGNHQGDHAIYPDCRKEFVEALDKASQLGTYNQIKLIGPYTELTKGDIALKGLQLGIKYGKETWTCYKGEKKPCGKCGSCVEREEALQFAKKELKK